MTKKKYSGDGFFRDQYRCVVEGGALVVDLSGEVAGEHFSQHLAGVALV